MAIQIGKPAAKKTVAKKIAAVKKAAPSRRYDDDDDDEPAPRSRRRDEDEPRDPPAKHAPTKRGWGAAEHAKETSYTTRFTKNLKIEAGETVVFKFLEDEPFAAVKVHWIEKKGKQSYLCPETEDCPLCAADVPVKFEARFNIAVLTDVEPVLRCFVTSGKRYDEVRAYGTAANSKPLSRKWYSYSRKGSSFKDTRYTLNLIRNRADIEEDFPDLHIPASEELEGLEVYDESTIDAERPSMKELREVAADLLGGGYDDD